MTTGQMHQPKSGHKRQHTIRNLAGALLLTGGLALSSCATTKPYDYKNPAPSEVKSGVVSFDKNALVNCSRIKDDAKADYGSYEKMKNGERYIKEQADTLVKIYQDKIGSFYDSLAQAGLNKIPKNDSQVARLVAAVEKLQRENLAIEYYFNYQFCVKQNPDSLKNVLKLESLPMPKESEMKKIMELAEGDSLIVRLNRVRYTVQNEHNLLFVYRMEGKENGGDARFVHEAYNKNRMYAKNDCSTSALTDTEFLTMFGVKCEIVVVDPKNNTKEQYLNTKKTYNVLHTIVKATTEWGTTLYFEPLDADGAMTYEQVLKKYKILYSVPFGEENAHDHSERASFYKARGDYRKALLEYNEAIRIAPDVAQFYADRGQMLYEKGDYREAKADLEKAVSLDSTDAVSYYWLAKAQLELNEKGNAWKSIESCLKYWKDYPYALALKWDEWNMPDEEKLKILQTIDKEWPVFMSRDMLLDLGKLWLGENDTAKRYGALSDLADKYIDYSEDKSLGKYQKNDMRGIRWAAHYLNGLAYSANGELDGAMDEFNKAWQMPEKDSSKKDVVALEIGNIYKEQGHIDLAEKWYTKASKLNAYNGRAREELIALKKEGKK